MLAESGQTVKVKGNHYFPPESLRQEYLTGSPTTSTCPWKGQARYYHARVNGEVNKGIQVAIRYDRAWLPALFSRLLEPFTRTRTGSW